MKIVIIGFGVAGATAATVVRENSPDAEISVFSDENHLYYPRPRLYEIITGEKKPEEIYTHNFQFYQNQRININLNRRASSIDTARKQITTSDGAKTDYDKLLLASGAHPNRPPIKGVEKAGVFTLRTVADAIAVRERAKQTSKLIIIGGGLLGLEFATCLRKLGKEVEIIELSTRLLPNQLDREGATLLKSKLEALNIHPILGVGTKEILGKESVDGVALDDGKKVAGGLVLIAAGIKSNTDLANAAGIRVNRGVIVDPQLQTSANEVYAAGDVAEFNGTVYGIIPPSIDQARIAAANIAGKQEQVYTGTVKTTSLKIAGISLTSMGTVNVEGTPYEVISKINKQEGIYKRIILDQGKIVGAILLGERKGAADIKRIMDQGLDVTEYEEIILENDFDFRQIA
jgi:nitrite reductase (NADH) large subunit